VSLQVCATPYLSHPSAAVAAKLQQLQLENHNCRMQQLQQQKLKGNSRNNLQAEGLV
jgi:hypothetical protein